MPVLINDYGNCATNVGGTGTTSCDFESMGDYLGKTLLDKSVTFAITNNSIAIDETIIDGLIQDRKAHQLTNRLSFTQDTPENEVFTDGTGLESTIREGKMKLSTAYARGLENAKAIYSLKGDNRWNVILHFTEGIFLTTNVDKTKAKGLDVGRFDVSNLKFLSGTDKQQVMTMMQVKSVKEILTYGLFIPYSKLGFDLSQKDGVIDCVVTVVTPPTASGTTMSVRVTPKSNTSTPVLVLGNITNWATGGTQTTPKPAPTAVVFNANTGNYDMTFGSAFIATDTFAPKLVDGSKSVVKDVTGAFYTGQASLGTV